MNIENIFTNSLPAIQGMTFEYMDIKWSHKRHAFPVWEMIYVDEGNVKLEIEKNSYRGKPGDIFFIPSLASHRDYFIEPYSYHVCTILFNWEWMPLFFKYVNNKNIKKLKSSARLEVCEIINKMWKEFRDGAPGFKLLMNMRLKEILVIIARNILKLHKKNIDKNNIEADSVLNIIHKYIDNHFSEQITLQTLSDKTKISTFYLTRLFSKGYGLPPHQYLIEVRIDNAKKLLADRKLSVKEIAYTVGFETSNYFGKAFRKVVGISPTKYRNLLFVSKR